MKRISTSLLSVFLLFLASVSFAVIQKSTAFVPEDLKLGGGLGQLKTMFYKTTDPQQQIRLVKMMTKNTQPKRYDVLMDIATYDIRMADKYGQTFTTAPEARLIAINYVGDKKDPKYSDAFASIITFEKYVDIRVAAAQALAKIGGKDAIKVLVNLVRYKYNYKNFREDNQQMYNDDRVVEGITKALGDIGDPIAFPALLEIVTKQNHRDATITAAWGAMNKLKW